uniref:Zf-ANAPC11 domain-containing protein n=1 Tax=Heterorhabditis bacteriophora TaxID=37862 RepID=A0A1I7X5L1_HETBA
MLDQFTKTLATWVHPKVEIMNEASTVNTPDSMSHDDIGEDTGSTKNKNVVSQPSEVRPFALKKWNALAMWAWDVECDTCAICRVHLMDYFCILFIANLLISEKQIVYIYFSKVLVLYLITY